MPILVRPCVSRDPHVPRVYVSRNDICTRAADTRIVRIRIVNILCAGEPKADIISMRSDFDDDVILDRK